VDERPCVLILITGIAAEQSLKVGVFDVRSVDKSLVLFAIAKRRYNSAESPSVVAATPPGYYIVERA